ncbi:ankyrin repeat-containing domain protein [Aspergillus karnatakaensis]|uniref:ankyrin repeat domain-containing protein n=1 Tax=Aspergillus karnatakaensis TaxID=1810916 RepID=UPI003CCCFE60
MSGPSSSTTIQGICQNALHTFTTQLSAEETLLFQATDTSEKMINDLIELDTKHKTSISRRITPNMRSFITGVERYGSAMDVIAGSTALMSPIWGCSRIVLQIAKEYAEYFDKLSEMFEEIGYNLTCLRRYPRLYPDNEVLREAMVDIFGAIIEFCAEARKVFREGRGRSEQSAPRVFSSVGLRTAWKLLWKPFKVQFGEVMDRIKGSMARVEREVEIAEKEMASEDRQKGEGERRLQASRWERLEVQQDKVVRFIDQQKIVQLNQWLAPINVAANHNSAVKLRQAGTGAWFVDGAAFRTWLGEENSFLWLHAIRESPTSTRKGVSDLTSAIAGAGKTILASTIIDWLKEHKERQGIGLAYFYCDYKDKQKQSPTRIISTLLSSIASRSEDVFDRISIFFEEQCKENPAYVPEFDELLNNFGDFIGDSFDELYIILDALDETEDRECVAHALKTISESCPSVRVLVTSRHEIDIARAYEDLPSTSIEPTDISGDIEIYVRSEVAAKIKAKKLKLRDPDLQNVICETLNQGAHGMFQWVKCQIDQLCKLRNDRAIRNALDDLPKTLHDTYIRILRKLELEFTEEVVSVQRLLRWLVRGTRNLTLEELAECASIDYQSPEMSFDFDAVFTDPQDVVELCGSLVVISSEGHVALAHYTVKEFLVSEHIKEVMPHFWIGSEDVHAELASVCLTYLCYDDFDQNEDQSGDVILQHFEEYKFFKYAVHNWGTHAHLSGDDVGVYELTMKLLDSVDAGRENYDVWCRVYSYLHRAAGQRPKLANLSALQFASLFGLAKVAATLLERDPDLDLADPIKAAAGAGHTDVVKILLDHSTPLEPTILEQCLYIASSADRQGVVEQLLQRGVNPNASSGKNGTPLQVAALEGRHQIVSVLLENGADMNITDQRYGSPLAAAAEKSHIQTAKLLLDKGANVNRRGGWYGYPLTSAITSKNTQMIELLIDRGANVNALGGRYGCPLMAAASLNMLDLIRSLVSYGARINDENDKGSDSLYSACVASHLEAVKLLLDLGADVNAKGGRHRNALNAASSTGNLEIVKCLLDAGADVEFFDDHYGNSVQVACTAGHGGVVRVLAEAGVDVNAPGADRGTALVAAAQNGHTEIVRLLFELGVPAGDTYEMTNALMVAARKGSNSTVELLVEMGACLDDVSTMITYPRCSPLEAAGIKSHSETVRLLLELGADVNYTNDGEYGTALIAAILSDRNTEVTQILLNAGAKINVTVEASHNAGGCPLGAAVSRGDYDMFAELIRLGADVNLSSGNLYTCLQIAAKNSDEGLVDLLMQNGADVNAIIEVSEDESDDGTITALQTAALYSNASMVTKLIELGADLHTEADGARYLSALQIASERNEVEILQVLLDAGSDVNRVGGQEGTSLQAAAFKGSLEAAERLIEAGADVNISGVGSNGSALMAAAIEEHTEVVKLLISHGADVNVAGGNYYEYPLQAAAYYGAEDIAQALVDAGADVNAIGGMYGTALQAAARGGELDVCQILLNNGADPNIVAARCGTALAGAYLEGYYQIISLLYRFGASHALIGGQFGSALGCSIFGSCQTLVTSLLRRHGADPNSQCGKYKSTLQACVCANRGDDVFEVLLENGADVNAQGGVLGTPLIAATSHGEVELMNALLDHGADVNLHGNWKCRTALHSAIGISDLARVKTLVEKGADVQNNDCEHGSPLEYAAKVGSLPIVRYLLRHGATIDVESKGRFHNVLQAAAIAGDTDTIRYLLNRGADIQKKGGKHGSILMASVLSCDQAVVELLLKKGADVNVRGGVYGSPLQAAAVRGSTALAILLLRYGALINARGGKFGTTLQAACVSGHHDLVGLLLERGAEVNAQGGWCTTALQAAALHGNVHICKLLLKHGAEWCLIDRGLSHFTTTQLDYADEILRDLRNGLSGGEEDGDVEEDEDEEEDEQEEGSRLQLNVDSIPFFDAPYHPAPIAQPESTTKATELLVQVIQVEDWADLELLEVDDLQQ